jgi:hypothetical protein
VEPQTPAEVPTAIPEGESKAEEIAPAATPVELPARQVADAPGIVLEAPYGPGAFPFPAGEERRRDVLRELALWNDGGRGAARWHPAPRIVVGEPHVTAGKVERRAVLAALRSKGYWLIRRCYETKLRDDPKLEGRTLLRLSIATDGTITSSRASNDARGVPDERKHGKAMRDGEVRDCMAKAMRTVHVPGVKRRATLLVPVDVWPGDAPLPHREEGPAARIDLGGVSTALRARAGELSACIERSRQRVPGLFGRMAISLDIDGNGVAARPVEVGSTFPDPAATACVTAVLAGVSWPKPSSPGRVIVALRAGRADTSGDAPAAAEPVPEE